jgi:peptidyl-prolyl cis-trans isomerase SurA
MKMQLNTLLLITIGLLAASSMHSQDTIMLDKLIAKVGSEIVFHSDLEGELVTMRERKMPTGRPEQCNVLESLLAQAMLVHYAKIDSVTVTEDEVNAAIDRRMNTILGYMQNDRKYFQEVYGQTVSEMREQVKEDMERMLLRERMQSTILEKIQVTPSEVIEFYNSIPKDSLPYFNAEVELAELVMYPKVNAEEHQKALDRINSLHAQIMAGADFAELARKHSDDGSARSGGDLDWSLRGTMVPEFEAVAFQLAKGQISEVVETEYGFHIIQLIERRVNQIHTRHILIRPDITPADQALTKNKMDSVRHLIEIDSLTFGEAVAKYGEKSVQSFSNNGRMINPKTGNTFYEIGDVDSEIYFSIDTLDVGEITPPIEYRSPIGDYFYKIVQLQSRSTPHQANLTQDYSRIQDAAKENKRSFAFSEWIDRHIANTYVTIDPSFSDCPNIEKWGSRWMVR